MNTDDPNPKRPMPGEGFGVPVGGCNHPAILPNDDYRKETMPFKCANCPYVLGAGQVEEVDGKLGIKDYSKYAKGPGRSRRR